jgi:menaquinone-9 beta-reductase
MVDFDVIIVGGGLGGASLARLLASNGVRVLVAERELQFKDRIRGEWMAPWGVAEAQRAGIYDLLMEQCAHENPYVASLGRPAVDLRTTSLQRLPALTFYHPAMQEVVLEAARSAGAEVWRGVSVREVKPGEAWRNGARATPASVMLCGPSELKIEPRTNIARWAALVQNRERGIGFGERERI